MRKFILIIALLISGVGLNAQNVGDNSIIDYEGYSLQFTITSVEPAECEVICSTQPTTETAITIPSSVEIGGMECSVTKVGNQAFSNCSNLTSIEIPNSVTSIGDRAFRGCPSLTSIEIPNSVTSIGGGAFSFCSSLTSIVVAEGNTVYDSRENCNAIIETSSNTLIAGCQNTVIPNSVTSIVDRAFEYCSSLTSIEIPNSVTSIGESAFFSCSSLTSIEIPNSVTSIGNSAFSHCYSLTNIEIPNSVSSIGNYAFSECTNLTSIETPNSVTSIGNAAFKGCSSLTSIEIPNSVTSIGSYVFAWCSSLTSIVVAEGNTVYDSRENCNAIIETSSNTLIAGCQNTVISNSVTSIGDYAFQGCSSLTSIEIPNSVTSIGDYAFWDCSSLTSIEIPNSVTSIGSSAFRGCSSLTSIICHAENVPETESSAFNDCPSDMIIYVPINSVALYQATEPWNNYNIVAIPEIGNNTIIDYEGYSLQFTITSIEPAECEVICSTKPTEPTAITIPYSAEISGIECSITSIGYEAFYSCSSLTNIEIPNSVTSIGYEAFSYCSSLTSIEIPNSVTSIGSSAFRGCSSLTSIVVAEGNTVYDSRENCNAIIETSSNTLIVGCQNTVIPNSVTSIGDRAFSYCSSLTSIEIPNSVTSIEGITFSGCSSLTSIVVAEGNTVYDSRENCNAIIETSSNTLIVGCQNTVIPNSVTSIGYYAFYCCSSLTSIEIPNSVTSIGNYAFSGCTNLTSIEIPNSVTSIGNSAFSSCYSLTNIEIPNSVTSIGNSAFFGCSELTSIEIPNSVTSIGNSAFSYCYSLTNIEIPNSVSSIGNYAFSSCNLTSIECHASEVPETESSAFNDCPSDMIIYVPINSFALYQATEPWNNYNIVAIPEIGDNTIIDYEGYSLQFTITSVEPAECEVRFSTHPTTGTAITIPSSVEIGGMECSVTKVGFQAFSYCNQLTSIEIPNSVTSIGNQAFYSCTNLTSIEIPNSVTSIGNYAFSYCYRLTSIEIPNSVTSIGNSAFSKCSALETMSVEEGNSVYDSRENCNAIIETETNTLVSGCKSSIIPNSVTSIGEEAFYYCNSLTSIEIPNSVTSIGNFAFDGCSELTSIEIPNSVSSIGNYAFSRCTYLTSIEIPNSVTSIGYGAFSNCSALETMSVEEGNSVYDSRENCNAIIKTETNTLVSGCKSSIIPNSVTSIGESAFYDCSGLTSIEIPNSVTSIGESAFYDCSDLTSIEIPNSVTSIGNSAFSNCSSLTSIEIPNSVTSIGNMAFSYCYNLTSIRCHAEDVPETDANTFLYCQSSMNIQVPENSVDLYKVTSPWYNYNITKIYPFQIGDNTIIDYGDYSLLFIIINVEPAECKVTCFTQPTEPTAITIPSSVEINEMEFSVTSIGYEAFSGCTMLTSIEIPNSVTSIGYRAFYNCDYLTSIEIPNSVTSIREEAFYYCI